MVNFNDIQQFHNQLYYRTIFDTINDIQELDNERESLIFSSQ